MSIRTYVHMHSVTYEHKEPRTHAPANAVKQHAIGCGTVCRCAQEQKKQRTHVHKYTRSQEQEKQSS